jgi:hypothetical protein
VFFKFSKRGRAFFKKPLQKKAYKKGQKNLVFLAFFKELFLKGFFICFFIFLKVLVFINL